MTFYQPYQEASEEYQRQSSQPAKTLKTAANIGIGIATGSTLLSRAIPFLSKFIPQSMALKGLSKINPTLGKFISSSENQGFDQNEILDFVKDKVNETTNQEEPAKQSGNIIKQYSPELFSFLKQNIDKGRNPIEAAAIAQNDKRFADVIKKLIKDHKTSWSEIIQGVFGTGKTAQNEPTGLQRMLSPAETPQEQQAAQQAASQLMGRGQPQPMQQQQQQGGIDPQLAQLLQQGNQIIQGLKGRL
jgi:hypothetical protein